MSDYILELDKVTYKYSDGTKALDDVSLRFEKGKKYALIGANGAGKSTLLLHLNGIRKPQEGTVLFGGTNLKYNSKSLNELRREVGIVFQEPDSQLFSPSVYQEISFGPINMGLSREEVMERVNEAMELTGITMLKDKATQFLSYGQKKRVAIADVLAMKPKVIVLDEPTASLDPVHEETIENILDNINSKGTTVIISTHDINMAYRWADYIFVLSNGKLIEEGEPHNIFINDDALSKAGIKKPIILDLFLYMKELNASIADCKAPKAVEDIKELIRGLI